MTTTLAERALRKPETLTPDEVKQLAAVAFMQPDRVSLMHHALTELRRILMSKTNRISRADLLPVILKGMGE